MAISCVVCSQLLTLMFDLCARQVIGTAMLLLCLMALSDQKNKPAAAGSEPVAVGLLVLLIGISLGSNSGYAINPTRDIAPRVFTAIAGWGGDVFRYTGKIHWHFGQDILCHSDKGSNHLC